MIGVTLILALYSALSLAGPTIIIKGQLKLPPVPLKALISYALGPDKSLDQAQFRTDLALQTQGLQFVGERPKLDHYPRLEEGQKFPYSSYFQVLAVAMRGPHREQRDFSNPDLAKAPFFLGTIKDDATYEIQAPAHPGEYMVVIQSEKVTFKRLVIASGMDGFVIRDQDVGAEQTVTADLIVWLERQGIFLTTSKMLRQFSDVIKEQVISLEMQLREGQLATRDMRQFGLKALVNALESRLKRKRLDDKHLPAPRSTPEYNLAFLGSTQKLQKLTIELWRELKRLKRNRQVLVQAKEVFQATALHPEVFPPNESRDSTLLYFKKGLRSFGFIAGHEKTRPLPFELKAYSEVGELIATYRWWSAEAGKSFYGFTGPQKVSTIEIRSPYLKQLKLSDFTGSLRYSKASDELWRSFGQWKKVVATQPRLKAPVPWVFDHYWRQVSAPLKVQERCTFDYNSSTGTYWQWSAPSAGPASSKEYGPQELISPSILLSYFPVEEEDVQSAEQTHFASWISGSWKGLDELEVLPGLSPCLEYTQTLVQNARLRLQGQEGFNQQQFRDAARAAHWGHLHFQSRLTHISSPPFFQSIEYSLDNGHSWTRAWWYDDEFHRGQVDRWWGAELDLFADSDLSARLAGESCRGSDFNQDGQADFHFDVGGDGKIDDKDCRQWDLRFYHYPQGPLSVVLPTAPELRASLIAGVNILVKFKLMPNPQYKNSGQDSAFSWEIDDVSVNGDMEELGFYTDFDFTHIPWE